MVLPEYIISSLTTICICGSIFILNNHCIKIRETADENKPKCVILTQEAFNLNFYHLINKINISFYNEILQKFLLLFEHLLLY